MNAICGGFDLIFRRLNKQMHNDARMMRSMRPPAAMAIPAIMAGFKFIASGLSCVGLLLLAASVALTLWLLTTGAPTTRVEAVLNAEVVLASKVVSGLKVVVADMIDVDKDCDISAVLVNVKSVVTVLRSELVVSRIVEVVVARMAEAVLLVKADVSAVVVAILRDRISSIYSGIIEGLRGCGR